MHDRVGFAIGFFYIKETTVPIAVAKSCTKCANSNFWQRGNTVELVGADDIVCGLPYADFGELFAPAWPE